MCETETKKQRQLECALLYEKEEERLWLWMKKTSVCGGEGVAGWKNTIGAGRNGLHMLLRRGCRLSPETLTFSCLHAKAGVCKKCGEETFCEREIEHTFVQGYVQRN